METTAKIRNTTNKIQAICEEITSVRNIPSAPAMSAMTRKIKAHFNMFGLLSENWFARVTYKNHLFLTILPASVPAVMATQ